MTRFVILCFPRTGSYLLTDLLNRHDGVTCHGEIFKKRAAEIEKKYRHRLGFPPKVLKERRDTDPVAYYNAVYKLTPRQVAGFKIFPSHNPTALREILMDPSIRKLFLARNPLQSFVSLQVAKQTGEWTRRGPEAAARHPKKKPDSLPPAIKDGPVRVSIPTYDLLAHIWSQREFLDHCRSAASLSGSPFMTLDYSDITGNPEKLDELASFLGMPQWNRETQSDMQKQITKPYDQIVENWNDVVSFLTHFHVALDDSFQTFTNRLLAA